MSEQQEDIKFLLYLKDESGNSYRVIFPLTADTSEDTISTMIANAFTTAVKINSDNTTTETNLYVSIDFATKPYYAITCSIKLNCYYPIRQVSDSNYSQYSKPDGTCILCGFINPDEYPSMSFLNNITFCTNNAAVYALSKPFDTIIYIFKDSYKGIYNDKACIKHNAVDNTGELIDGSNFQYISRPYNIFVCQLNNTRYYYGITDYTYLKYGDTTSEVLRDQTQGMYTFKEMCYRFVVILQQYFDTQGLDIVVYYSMDNSVMDYHFKTSDGTVVTDQYSFVGNLNNMSVNVHPGFMFGYQRSAEYKEPILNGEYYFVGVTEAGVHWWSGPIYDLTGNSAWTMVRWQLYLVQHCYGITADNITTEVFTWGITSVDISNQTIVVYAKYPVKLINSYPINKLTYAQASVYYGSKSVTNIPPEYMQQTYRSIYEMLVANGPETSDTYAGYYYHVHGIDDSLAGSTTLTFYRFNTNNYYGAYDMVYKFCKPLDTLMSENYAEKVSNDLYSFVVQGSNNVKMHYVVKWTNGGITVNNKDFTYNLNKIYYDDQTFCSFIARCIYKSNIDRYNTEIAEPVLPWCFGSSRASDPNEYDHWSIAIEANEEFTINAVASTGNVNQIVKDINAQVPYTGVRLALNWRVFETVAVNQTIYLTYKTNYDSKLTSFINYARVKNLYNLANIVEAINYKTLLCDTRTYESSVSLLKLTNASKTDSSMSFVFNSSVALLGSYSKTPGLFQYYPSSLNVSQGIDYSGALHNAMFYDIADMSNDSVITLNKTITIYNSNYHGYFTNNGFTLVTNGNTVSNSNAKMFVINSKISQDVYINHEYYYMTAVGSNLALDYNFNIPGVKVGTTTPTISTKSGVYKLKDMLDNYARSIAGGILLAISPANCAKLGISVDYTCSMLNSDYSNFPCIDTTFTIRQSTAGSVGFKFPSTNRAVPAFSGCSVFSYLNLKRPEKYFTEYSSSVTIRGCMFAGSNGSNFSTDGYLYLTTGNDTNSIYRMFMPLKNTFARASTYTSTTQNLTIDAMIYAAKGPIYRVSDNTLASSLKIVSVASTDMSVTWTFNANVNPIYSIPTTSLADNVSQFFVNNIVQYTRLESFSESIDSNVYSYPMPGIDTAYATYLPTINSAYASNCYAINFKNYGDPVKTNKIPINMSLVNYGVYDSNESYIPFEDWDLRGIVNDKVIDNGYETLVYNNGEIFAFCINVPRYNFDINVTTKDNTIQNIAYKIPTAVYKQTDVIYQLARILSYKLFLLDPTNFKQDYAWYNVVHTGNFDNFEFTISGNADWNKCGFAALKSLSNRKPFKGVTASDTPTVITNTYHLYDNLTLSPYYLLLHSRENYGYYVQFYDTFNASILRNTLNNLTPIVGTGVVPKCTQVTSTNSSITCVFDKPIELYQSIIQCTSNNTATITNFLTNSCAGLGVEYSTNLFNVATREFEDLSTQPSNASNTSLVWYTSNTRMVLAAQKLLDMSVYESIDQYNWFQSDHSLTIDTTGNTTYKVKINGSNTTYNTVMPKYNCYEVSFWRPLLASLYRPFLMNSFQDCITNHWYITASERQGPLTRYDEYKYIVTTSNSNMKFCIVPGSTSNINKLVPCSKIPTSNTLTSSLTTVYRWFDNSSAAFYYCLTNSNASAFYRVYVINTKNAMTTNLWYAFKTIQTITGESQTDLTMTNVTHTSNYSTITFNRKDVCVYYNSFSNHPITSLIWNGFNRTVLTSRPGMNYPYSNLVMNDIYDIYTGVAKPGSQTLKIYDSTVRGIIENYNTFVPLIDNNLHILNTKTTSKVNDLFLYNNKYYVNVNYSKNTEYRVGIRNNQVALDPFKIFQTVIDLGMYTYEQLGLNFARSLSATCFQSLGTILCFWSTTEQVYSNNSNLYSIYITNHSYTHNMAYNFYFQTTSNLCTIPCLQGFGSFENSDISSVVSTFNIDNSGAWRDTTGLQYQITDYSVLYDSNQTQVISLPTTKCIIENIPITLKTFIKQTSDIELDFKTISNHWVLYADRGFDMYLTNFKKYFVNSLDKYNARQDQHCCIVNAELTAQDCINTNQDTETKVIAFNF